MSHLHIDIETYCSVDIRKAGAYRYTQGVDFEILMVAYAFDDEPVTVVDLAAGELLPERFTTALTNPQITKMAHNAVFERQAFKQWGYDIPADQWECTAVKSAYCGLPLSLAQVSAALKLDADGKAKAASGKALIRYFSIPCRPTKKNGGRTRNYWHHDREKWEAFKAYCAQDVEAERAIHRRLAKYPIPAWERANYVLDQKINDRGVKLDLDLAYAAMAIDATNVARLMQDARDITGLSNPNSLAQLKEWLGDMLGKEINSLDKDAVNSLLEVVGEGPVRDMLSIRKRLSKSSVKKYMAMPACAGFDDRARGLLQFYGAGRTGRWAGRLIQLQNLPRNYIEDLDGARQLLKTGDLDTLKAAYPDVSSTLSQLIRTALVASEGHVFAVADFSAIEARVLAWVAGETWRMDVFNTHGKIYEASASAMFKVPIEEITKGSDIRAKGKVAELALGYQGGVGALKTMGGERMGLSELEMQNIVGVWRESNPSVCKFWRNVEQCAKRAIRNPHRAVLGGNIKNLKFLFDGSCLRILLPSGRCLFYHKARFGTNRFGRESIQYKGRGPQGGWVTLGTYGGKLTENIVQAIARDLLAFAMQTLDKNGFDLALHVHDEAIAEVPTDQAEDSLAEIEKLMAIRPIWAKDLPLSADGYTTPYYKKD